jgi:hypothetical protein
MILQGQVEDNNIINVTFGKIVMSTPYPSPFEILQGHFSNQMDKTTIGINNPSHED